MDNSKDRNETGRGRSDFGLSGANSEIKEASDRAPRATSLVMGDEVRSGLAAIMIAFSAASPATAHEADQHMRAFCMPDVREACERDMAEFRQLYAKAFKRDYQAQRNVAYLLSKGNNAVFPDHVAACAWRAVIVGSGSPKVDASDHANRRHFCGRVDPARRGEANSIAADIARRIAAGGKIDTLISPPDSTLDRTAEPL